MMRLFSAWSIVDNVDEYEGVTINWCYAGRKKPLAPYDELIADYHSLDRIIRQYMEDYVCELFTEEEIMSLRAYLLRRSPSGGALPK